MALAPYPAETRAKGWRFELDMERARQSDTWALASPEARPWLLMLWATAWEQTPCGSLPNDDELIAARLGMPEKLFAKHRSILLRKWWAADDGRLYHDVLVLRVTEMMQTRRKESDRKALSRSKNTMVVPQEHMSEWLESMPVPCLSHGTTTGVPHHVHPESDTGTGTRTIESQTLSPGKPDKADPEGFAEFWNAWPSTSRKQDRKKCAEKWRWAGLGPKLSKILGNIGAMRESKPWRDGFEPAPLTYLNGERWDDGAETARAPSATVSSDEATKTAAFLAERSAIIGTKPPAGWAKSLRGAVS